MAALQAKEGIHYTVTSPAQEFSLVLEVNSFSSLLSKSWVGGGEDNISRYRIAAFVQLD